MRRVFVDTSVLLPFSVMDLLLALTENGLQQVVWTDELLDEWERVIVREHRRSPTSAASVTAAIREVFDDMRIDLSELFDEFPDDFAATIVELARTKTRPPLSIEGLLDTLMRAGLSELPARVRTRL